MKKTAAGQQKVTPIKRTGVLYGLSDFDPDGDQLLNIDQVAELLGYSKDFVYRLTSERTIPHSKPRGGRLFFSRREVMQWAMRSNYCAGSEARETAVETYLAIHKC